MFTLQVGREEFGALVTEILESGSALRFRASGSSMVPFILSGDILEVQPLGTQPIRLGDVILCQRDDQRVVAHRVTRLSRQQGRAEVAIQGDALIAPDGWITSDQVMGRVVRVERRGRNIAVATGWHRWLALLWLSLSPFIKGTYRVLKNFLHRSKVD